MPGWAGTSRPSTRRCRPRREHHMCVHRPIPCAPLRTPGSRYLTHRMPPPDSALSAVGGGPATPAPPACTALAVVGALPGEGLAVAKPPGIAKLVPITTRMLPGRSPALGWVDRPPSALARTAALPWPPAPYCTSETAT